MDIQELYRRRRKCTITGILFLMIGLIGLAIERFAQAKDFDKQIKELAIKNESKIDYVILNCSCGENPKETENK